MPSLELWMNGTHVGRWERVRGGIDRLFYARDWMDSSAGRPISLSLPFTPAGDTVGLRTPAVAAYFANLIPENNATLERVRARFGARSKAAFDLLAILGRDCAGSLQLTPEGSQPEDFRCIDATPLSESGIAELLRQTTAPDRGLVDRDAFRLSIAGAQEKTALLRHDGAWCVPHHSTPTTHLFKLPLGLVASVRADLSFSVELEWLCMKLAAEFGLNVAQVEIGRFEDQRALIVERFDRKLASNGQHWLRLPQEDFCQVFGLDAALKYEVEGGPGAAGILEVLRNSSEAEADRAMFFRALAYNWLIGGTDAHAKNYSVAHLAGSRFRLTPFYDVLSTYPIHGKGLGKIDSRRSKLAMAVDGKNKHYALHDIHRWHWIAMGNRCGVLNVSAMLDEMINRVGPAFAAIEGQLPADFPADVYESVRAGTSAAADRLAREPDCRG